VPKYYLHRNDQNHGPYEESQIRQMLASLEILGEEMICAEGGSEWQAASSLAPQQAAQLRPSLIVNQQAVAASPTSGAIQEPIQPQKKGMNGCLQMLLLGLGLLVVMAIIGFFMKSQDDDLRAYGIAQIEALGIDQDKKLISLALAEHVHLRSANSGTRVSKKSLNTVSEEDYWSSLQREMKEELQKLKGSADPKEIAGNRYLYRALEEGAFYVLEFDKIGKYEKSKFWTSPKEGETPTETEKGNWEISSSSLVLKPAGGSGASREFLLMSRLGFIVKTSTISAEYWKKRP
jgi:hypothetical protein